MTNSGCSAPPQKPLSPSGAGCASAGVAAKVMAKIAAKQASTAKSGITGRPMSATIAIPKSLPHIRGSEMPTVTISAIDTLHVRIPLDTWAPPPMFAGRPRTHVEAIYIKVTCSDGTVGWGEAFGSSGTAVIAAYDNWIPQLAGGKDLTDP